MGMRARTRLENRMELQNKARVPYALAADEGWTYRFGIDFTVKAGEMQPGSSAAFLEYTTRPGEEPPPHTHPGEDEMFYVLEGSLTFQCGDASFDVAPGGFVFLPRGLKHGYTIHGGAPARLIVVTAPARAGAGGWGGFVADMENGQGELINNPRQDR